MGSFARFALRLQKKLTCILHKIQSKPFRRVLIFYDFVAERNLIQKVAVL